MTKRAPGTAISATSRAVLHRGTPQRCAYAPSPRPADATNYRSSHLVPAVRVSPYPCVREASDIRESMMHTNCATMPQNPAPDSCLPGLLLHRHAPPGKPTGQCSLTSPRGTNALAGPASTRARASSNVLFVRADAWWCRPTRSARDPGGVGGALAGSLSQVT